MWGSTVYKETAIIVFDGIQKKLEDKGTKIAERAYRISCAPRDTIFDETMSAASHSQFISIKPAK